MAGDHRQEGPTSGAIAPGSAAPDGFGGAGRALRLVAIFLAVTLAMVAAPTFNRLLVVDRRPALVHALGLTELTLVPSGQPPRTPTPAAVDLRQVPGQPGDGRSRPALPWSPSP